MCAYQEVECTVMGNLRTVVSSLIGNIEVAAFKLQRDNPVSIISGDIDDGFLKCDEPGVASVRLPNSQPFGSWLHR